MANQRKKGIERVTLTLPDEMLAQIQADAEEQGKDRLALMREVLADYLAGRKSTQLPKSSKRVAKPD